MSNEGFQLVVPGGTWSRAMCRLSTASSELAVAKLSIDHQRHPTGLLVDDLRVVSSDPNGSEWPPLASWCVIAMPGGDPPNDPRVWIERLRPSYAQLFTVLLLGFGDDRSGWRGWTVEQGEVRPLAGFQLVGPLMLRVGDIASEGEIFPEDPQRWSRVEGAVGSGFAQLRRSSVTLIGCSRSGTLAAVMLASLGVRKLSLVDGDKIELHNLDGMFLAAEQDLGRNKAEVIAERLIAFRPNMAISISPHALGSHDADFEFGDTDLVVTCVDRDAPRLRAAKLCNHRLIPHLDIATGVSLDSDGSRQMAADVRLLLPGEGCIECVGGLRSLVRAAHELEAVPGAWLPWPVESWESGKRLGSLITLNSTAVGSATVLSFGNS
ncbi:MAG: ThiF family adenylyltransferase [Planctomycetota bacterium]